MRAPTQTVFLFSGQGSQFFQMGRTLFEEQPGFARLMRRMDTLVTEMTGRSVLSALYGTRGFAEPFVDIETSHPAIFMVEYALARTLIDGGIEPGCTLGASLGSFAAASISGCMSMETALALVVEQARIVRSRCMPGNMVAVLASPADCQPLIGACEIASVNFASHLVLSVPAGELPHVESFLRERALSFQVLPVQFAFHSSWIEPARLDFEAAVSQCQHHVAAIPLVCCASATQAKTLPQGFFWNAVRAPMRLPASIQALEAAGPRRYIDVGPSGTLATFLKYILPAHSASTARAIITPHAREMQALSDITGRPAQNRAA